MTYNSLGAVLGIIIGIIIAVLVLKMINKNGKFKTEYDERQKAIRGRAYQYGFWATIIGNALIMLLMTTNYDITKLGLSLNFIPILIGVVVQVTYCIFNDGYVGLNTNMTKFMIFMTVISAFNFFIGIGANMDGRLIEDGVFQGPFLNILCGGLFIILAIELLIKKIKDGATE